MIYAVKKFRHYLLANKFTFFVDHQALLYLVNKPCNIGRIIRWFIILLEFDFTVVVKKGTTHMRADHLSRLVHGEKPTGVEDDLPDAYLFNVEMVPRWFEDIVQILTLGLVHEENDKTMAKTKVMQAKHFQMIARRLYHLGEDYVLRLCLIPEEYDTYLNDHDPGHGLFGPRYGG